MGPGTGGDAFRPASITRAKNTKMQTFADPPTKKERSSEKGSTACFEIFFQKHQKGPKMGLKWS